MAFTLGRGLQTLSDDDLNKTARGVWEGESLGGITEDNNRVPMPIVWLLILTVITAFAVTFPLWGQRPNAAMYADYVKSMSDPSVTVITDDAAAMVQIKKLNPHPDNGRWDALLERHPLTMDDLRIIAPQIQDLMKVPNIDLSEYNVVGDRVRMANFEGNKIDDGHGGLRSQRKQPWWDKGYFIDIFFILFFFTGVTIAIKRLPPSSWQPRHSKDH
jgi:hypothetical protein